MAKVVSLQGVAKGKVGSMVYSVTGGQMVARSYQPNVANPNTQAQVDQRAKMKLMSQIAAAMAPVIVIPKEGLKSSRNLFIKKNFDTVSAESGVAQLTYENLQLTSGNAGIPGVFVRRSQQSGISVNLEDRCDAAVSRVVYILYRKTSEQTLQYVQSIIVNAAGSEGTFPGSLIYVDGDIIVFAYGMKDLSAKATAKYSDYSVSNGEDIARLALSRNISMSDFQFTRTRGTTLFAGESESAVVGENQSRVYVTAAGPGSVAGAGIFDNGTQVTVIATPDAEASFVGWRKNGTTTIISTNASYTFTLNELTDLVAVFRSNAAAQEYTINVSAGSGVTSVGVTNNGIIEAGQSCTLTATMGNGRTFGGWYDVTSSAARLLSTSNPYTFTPSADMEIEARREDWDDGE